MDSLARGATVRPLVSIVAPFYNEELGIVFFVEAIAKVMASCAADYDYEVVCVDDGSSDRTLELLQAVAAKDPRYTVVELSRNFGKEPALTAGIDTARGDCVVPIDADLQDPPELIITMLEKWREGYEVVLAKRADRSSDSYLKRVTAAGFYRFHNKLSKPKIPENVGDYRLMDRVVVDALKRLPETQRFMKGIFAWVGYKTTTVEYARQARHAGESKFTGWKLWNFAIEGITSFSIAPLKLWTYIGAIGAVLTILWAIFIAVRTILFGIDAPGYASLLAAMVFFGSLQLLSIGVVGEYIGRIYMESKGRPIYLIRKIHKQDE